MTDNFNLYRKYISLMSPNFPKDNSNSLNDKFYVIELMRRGKDNPNMPAANIHFKNYYIFSWYDYEKFESEIKEICTLMRMRAYASVNWKSNKQVALNTVAAMAQRVATGDYKKIWSEWSSQVGLYSYRNENVWILDLDDIKEDSEELKELIKVINDCRSQFDNNDIMIFPTKSGSHLLTHPFDINEFSYKVWKNQEAMKCLKEFNEKYIDHPNKIRLGEGFIESKILEWCNNGFIHKNHVTLLFENL